MLKAGVFFCPHCGEIYHESFYMSGSRKSGVYLHRSSKDKYAIVPAVYEDQDKNLDIGDVTLYSWDKSQGDGLPWWIEVQFRGESSPVRMYRYCPHCAKPVFQDSGKYPMFVVGMVGDRSSGKSAWLNSLSYPENVKAINDIPFPYKLDIQPFAHERHKSEATIPLARGMTKLLSIQDHNRKTIAHVLLLDVSGELYGNNPNIDQDLIWRFLCGAGDYPGADAFVFIQCIPSVNQKINSENEFNSEKICQQCLDTNAFGDKPLAYVYTHLDKLIESGDFPRAKDLSGKPSIPRMSKHTFTRTSYEPAKLIPRIYTEDCVAREYHAQPLMVRTKWNTKGFMVQSCEFNQPMENYTRSINVMDPLLWILNKLHLFPLTMEDEI